jgi:ribose 5-phosphate isomerase B
MKVILGTDHRGFDLKEEIKRWLSHEDHEVEDKGAYIKNPRDDYPDFIVQVARLISLRPDYKGIILGHTGQGEAMLANKFLGVRSVVYYGGPLEVVRLSRSHNDANILSIGASFVDDGQARAAIELWLDTPFSGEARHNRRLNKVAQYDRSGIWG